MTYASLRGIDIASASPFAVLNSTTYVPSSFGPKIMMRFLDLIISSRADLAARDAPMSNRTPSI